MLIVITTPQSFSPQDPCFLRSGDPTSSPDTKPRHFLSTSLFDPGGAENHGQRPEFILSQQHHLELVTESFAELKYGAFWFDYLYVMELPPEKEGSAGRGILF